VLPMKRAIGRKQARIPLAAMVNSKGGLQMRRRQWRTYGVEIVEHDDKRYRYVTRINNCNFSKGVS
jgi:hypothetical protein